MTDRVTDTLMELLEAIQLSVEVLIQLVITLFFCHLLTSSLILQPKLKSRLLLILTVGFISNGHSIVYYHFQFAGSQIVYDTSLLAIYCYIFLMLLGEVSFFQQITAITMFPSKFFQIARIVVGCFCAIAVIPVLITLLVNVLVLDVRWRKELRLTVLLPEVIFFTACLGYEFWQSQHVFRCMNVIVARRFQEREFMAKEGAMDGRKASVANQMSLKSAKKIRWLSLVMLTLDIVTFLFFLVGQVIVGGNVGLQVANTGIPLMYLHSILLTYLFASTRDTVAPEIVLKL